MRWFWLCLLIGGVVGCSEDTPRTVAHCLSEGVECPTNHTCKTGKDGLGACFYSGGQVSPIGGQDSMAGSMTPRKVA